MQVLGGFNNVASSHDLTSVPGCAIAFYVCPFTDSNLQALNIFNYGIRVAGVTASLHPAICVHDEAAAALSVLRHILGKGLNGP
jgi:DUF1365 family protein